MAQSKQILFHFSSVKSGVLSLDSLIRIISGNEEVNNRMATDLNALQWPESSWHKAMVASRVMGEWGKF